MSGSTRVLAHAPGRRAARGVRGWVRDRAVLALAVTCVAAALLALDVLLGRYTTFFESDQAVKYLAISAIAHHWGSAAITYPFSQVDARGTYILPTTAWYGGHEYAGYSLPFEYVTAIFYTVWGGVGLVFPSIVATVGLLGVQLQLAAWLDVRSRVGLILATVSATPLLFYALNLWEHSLGVAFVIAGIAALLMRLDSARATGWTPILAGVLFFSAVLMRREMLIVAAVAIGVSAAFNPRLSHWLRLGLVAAVLAVPIYLILHFHPQPLALGLTHASPGRAPVGVSHRPVTRWQHVQWLAYGGYATVLFAVATLAVATSAIWRRQALIPVIALGSLAVGFAYAVHTFQHFSYANDNPIAFCPIAVWAIWSPVLLKSTSGGMRRHLALYSITVLAVLAIIWEAYEYGGGQWGPRYLLFAFPLLVLLAFWMRDQLGSLAASPFQHRLIFYSFAILLSLSVGIQALSLVGLAELKGEWSQAQSTVKRLPERVVVSPLTSTLGDLDVLNSEKTILFPPTHRDLTRLLAMLEKLSVSRFAYVCATHASCRLPEGGAWRHGRIRTLGQVRWTVYHRSGRK